LATTHEPSELLADVVVHDLSAVSVQATGAGVEIVTAG
jgi:mannitol-1-/sugar-/sorbitol-6-phosphatase